MDTKKRSSKKANGPNSTDVVRARAFKMGFLGEGESMRRVRPDHIVNVTREFLEANKHWLKTDEHSVFPQDKRKFDKRPMKMDVI